MNLTIFEKALKIILEQKADRERIFKRLTTPERIIQVFFPVKIRGEEKLFQGYRVQFNSLLGPYKGGIRFHPQLNLEEVKILSFLMMVKCALLNLPFGGGKGGVVVDPKKLSRNELEELSRSFCRTIFDCLGPYKDVPAPDVNTNPQIMKWMVDEFKIRSSELKTGYKNNELLAVFTGKPVEDGGSLGREEATGLGGAVVLKAILSTPNSKLKIENSNLTAAVQGFGNVGFYVAKFLSEMGFKVVAVSDSKGGITTLKEQRTGGIEQKKSDGIDIEQTLKCKREKGTVAGCYCLGSVCDFSFRDKFREITNEELLELPVDILVPAALENSVNKKNASKIKAKVILEMANSGVDPEAYGILKKRGITVIPDILANSGGVTVSYFEWKQNLENSYWPVKKVHQKLEFYLKKTVSEVLKTRSRYKTDLRTACYIVAANRLIRKIN